MRCPTLTELPPPPPGKTGWPWTVESPQLPDTMPDGSPWPRVSIVTPSYNQAQFIEETIRSVLLQGYPNLEYIIIDGGSTDDSVEIIRKYEPWLAYWVSESDRGQSHAINKGFARATGEIVAWLNSDDVYCPETLAAVARQFTLHPLCGLIYADSRFIDETGEFIQSITTRQYDPEELIFSQAYLPQQSTFVSAHALSEQGLLDEELHYAMDFDLWLRIVTAYPYRHVPDVWSGFRLAAGTKTVSQSHRFWPEIATILQSRRWEGRIPSELLTKAVREAQFTAGLALIRVGETEDGIRFVENAFSAAGYPFGNLLNCVYITLDRLANQPDSRVRIANIAAELARYSRCTGNHELHGYALAVRVFHGYLHRDLATTRRWGLQAMVTSGDFRRSSKLVGIVAKSLLGEALLDWGRAIRRPQA